MNPALPKKIKMGSIRNDGARFKKGRAG